MQNTVNKLTNPTKSFAAGTWVALLSVLTLGLCATVANAQKNVVVTGPAVSIGVLGGTTYNDGWDGSQSPLGGSFIVGANGNVIVGGGYGGKTVQINPNGTQPSNESSLAMLGGAAAAMDSYGNIYIASDAYYGGATPAIYKLPYSAATATYAGFTTAPTASCLGGTQDSAACVFVPQTQALLITGVGNGNGGFADLAFDTQGNFFFATDTQPGNNPNSIYECNVACLASPTGTATLVFADSKPMGAIAVDPWGNLFFVDGYENGAVTGKVSNLNELPFASGTYASTPTVLESYTTSAGYNGLSGLAIASNGTVYFATNADGIFALPNTKSGGPVLADIYAVSTVGGKGIALDSRGNLYQIPYDSAISGDGVSFIPVNNIALAAAPIGGTATTATATVIDSAAACTPTLALAATENGVKTTEFSAAAGTTCSAALGTGNGTFSPALPVSGSAFTVTFTFTPTKVGERSAALTITDATNSASGTTTLSGVGQGVLANLDPGVWTSYASGFTTPYSVSVDAAGDLAVADEGGAVYWIPAGSPAGTKPTSIGTGFGKPAATAFDANGNLYIADFEDNDIVEIPNVGGALVPASQSTVVADTATFAGTALNKPSGLAIGPDGLLYISDLGNSRVVTYDPSTGETALAVTGLKDPWGLAVDAADNLYIANTGDGNVLEYAAGAVIATLTPAGVTAPWGVAVDPSGSVLISDKGTGNIVWVPNDSKATPPGLTDSEAVLIEKNPSSALGIALDAWGDLYTTDSTGAAVYAIQRTAALVNFGTVQDGVSSDTWTIYAEVTGNMPVTLGTPAFTAPTSSDFTLTSTGTNNKCQSASSGQPGQSCQLQTVFTPPVGTAAGPISGTSTLSSNALNAPSATITLTGTATLSSVLPQTITKFTPPASLFVGQQTMLSATGGASGNPVVFTIDSASTCPTCATISGTTLTASGVGSVIVDANQAAGTSGGASYAAAPQVQATIAIANPTAADVPALVMSQIVWSYQSGAFTDGQNPAGGSFAVTQDGEIVVGTSYNNKADFINASTGALIQQIAINGAGGFTIDSHNNLYMSHLYGPSVLKIPYVAGAYATLTDTAPANCTGTDTTLCTFATVGTGGVKAIAFDPAGNFYMVTVPGSTGASAIYECATGCQTGGTGTLVYSDVNAVSQVAFDPWGNLFFADGAYANATNFSNDEVSTSSLYELPYTAGTGFAATPVLLQTLTDAGGNLHSYDNQLDGVAVTSNGTIYYADQNDGTFAIPNTQAGGPDLAHQYVVSTLGAKGMELDANGNEWVVVYYSGGDNLGEGLIGDLTAPTAQLDGAATTASATVMDNAIGCGTTAILAFTSSNPEFSATETSGTTCSTVSADFTTPVSASSYGATVSFSATAGGPQTGTLDVVDTANGGTGTATVTGMGQETPQNITFTAPVTTTYVFGVSPITLAATGGASNNPVTFSIDTSSTGTGTITGGNTLTVTGAGTLVIDANQVGGLVGGIYYSAATQAQLTITINQASQTIAFTPPATPVAFVNGLTIPLYATSTSGETVVFNVDAASTGAGTISGSTLTVTAVGNLIIDANVPNSTNYAAAPQAQQPIVVNQGSQTIVFAPPTSPVNFLTGLTISLAATGGGSGLPVAFTLDANSTATGTISTSVLTGGISTATLTVTGQGVLVIDANQAGNTNFMAATQVQQSVSVLAALPTQTISFPNPGTQVEGTTLSLSATATSSLPVSFTTLTTSVCTLSGATGATATFIAAGTCTITASQGGNSAFAAAALVSQSFIVNSTGVTPNISFNLSLSTLSVAPGTVGITQLTVNSVNSFAGTVTFACSGLPSGASCTFTPNPITIMAGQSAVTTLSVDTQAATAAVHHDSRPLFPAATLAVALCLFGFKKRSRLQLLLLLVIGIVGFGAVSGCGGNSATTTKPVSTTVTVTATAGAVSQSSTFTLLVQ